MSRDLVLQSALVRQLVMQFPGTFDSDERKQHWHTKKLDALGMCLVLCLYIWASWACGADVSQDEKVQNTPGTVVACQVIGALISLYNLYVECYVLPRGTKDAEDDFHVTYGPFGRWVYLTHQTIGVLAVHSLVSVLSLLFPPGCCSWLAGGSYAATPVVGAAGFFVTIQYFNLVYPHSEHKRTCQMWAKRGVYFGFIDSMRHAFPMLVVVLDVLAKHRATLLLAMPSIYGIICINLIYVLLFACLTHANYAITGYWQYSFMKGLGQNPQKWFIFIAVQGSILSACGLSVSLLARLVTLW